MPKFHVPLVVEVECASLNEARTVVYRILETVSLKDFPGGEGGKITPTEIVMADDSQKDRANHRIVFLHPEDVSSCYDSEAYEKNLKEDEDD
jgi:hypothetical protein